MLTLKIREQCGVDGLLLLIKIKVKPTPIWSARVSQSLKTCHGTGVWKRLNSWLQISQVLIFWLLLETVSQVVSTFQITTISERTMVSRTSYSKTEKIRRRQTKPLSHTLFHMWRIKKNPTLFQLINNKHTKFRLLAMSSLVMDLESLSTETRKQESAQLPLRHQLTQESSSTHATRKVKLTQANSVTLEPVSKSAELIFQVSGLKSSQKCMRHSTGLPKTTTFWDGQACWEKQEKESLVSNHHTTKISTDGTKPTPKVLM